MVQPIDQGAILAGGRNLVPDYAAEALRRSLLGIQQQEAQTSAARETRLTTTANREQQRIAEYQAAVEAMGENPTAQGYAALMARFPEFSEGVRRSFQSQDEAQQRTDFQQMADIYHAASSGNLSLAARTYRARIDADTTAGQPPDPIEQAILAGLESADPAEQRHAVEALGYTLSAIGGAERFSEVYGRIEPAPVVIDDILVDPRSGEAIAQSPYPRVHLGPDGSSVTYNPVPGIPLIGSEGAPTPAAASPTGQAEGPSGATSERTVPPAAQLGPVNINRAAVFGRQFGTVTSTRRSPRHNREVGGARNSFHLDRNGARAVDIARRRGVTHTEIVAAYQRAGYTLHPDTRDEGDHSHIVIASMGQGSKQPRRVRSVQEYNRLPTGTEYVDPNGVRRRKT